VTSHELARLLLKEPDLPVAVCAMGHAYLSAVDLDSHGPLQVGLMESYGGRHIAIGDALRRVNNGANWKVTAVLHSGRAVK
jgi:hypothetical protein